MPLGPLIRHYGLAAAIAEDRIVAVGATWAALLDRDPTGAPPSALGLGDALAPALAGTTVDAEVGRARLRVRGVPFGNAIVLLATDITDLRPLPARPAATGLRLLVVDHDDLVRDALTRILTELGHAVTPMATGTAAIATAHAHDLLLLDLSRARGGGLSAVRAIRATERAGGRRLPIVGITDAPHGDADAIAAGVDACLLAPITAAALIEVCAACAHGEFAPPIDFATFLRRVGGHPAVATEIAAMFSSELASVTVDLSRAIATADGAAIAAEAHRVRGALVQVAASRAQELTREIEHRASDATACGDLLAQLRRELARAASALTAYAAG
ncbi:MAG: response regulator [Deltaproteobacteria bacterium]|nr:response regulator [Deltaproteobacteria bacterium]